MRNITLLLPAIFISYSISSVNASNESFSSENYYENTSDSTENDYDQVLKSICREIWNDNLFYANKDKIFEKIKECDYLNSDEDTRLYISEILIRMLQDKVFRNIILNNKMFNTIKNVLKENMKEIFVSDYFDYYNYREEPLESYKINYKQYKEDLLSDLYILGYDSTLDFEKYAEECMKLYNEL